MAVVPPFVLGQLLEAWRDGVLKRGDLYFYKGIGSPLSGTHKVYGFSTEDGRTQSVPQGLGSYSGTRQLCRAYQTSQSKWSLGQVLVDLGLQLPATIIYQHGVAIGQYDYANHILTLHNQTWDLSYEFISPHEATIIGTDMSLQQFVLHRQNIKHEGNVLAHWTQDLPPIVAQHICIHLANPLYDRQHKSRPSHHAKLTATTNADIIKIQRVLKGFQSCRQDFSANATEICFIKANVRGTLGTISTEYRACVRPSPRSVSVHDPLFVSIKSPRINVQDRLVFGVSVKRMV